MWPELHDTWRSCTTRGGSRVSVLPLQMPPVPEDQAKPTLLEMVAPIQQHLGVVGNWVECIAAAEKMLGVSPGMASGIRKRNHMGE